MPNSIANLSKRPKWVEVCQYPCYAGVAFTTDDLKRMKSSEPEWFDDGDALGFVDPVTDCNYLVALNVNAPGFGFSVVAHEGIHFINAVMRRIGAPATREWFHDEHDAYLMGWYVNLVRSEFQRRTGYTLESFLDRKPNHQ